MPSWLDNWISPAGFMIVVGAIIWGIQLNIAVISHTERLAEIKTAAAEHELRDLEWGKTLGQTVILLNELEKRVSANTRHAEDHEREAADWKYRIIDIESKLKNRVP
jgi:5-bromo-4-chloroindolyl phosphate hydrolysis protein